MPLFQYAGFELIFLSGCPSIGVHRRDLNDVTLGRLPVLLVF